MGYFDPKLQLLINNVVVAGWTTADPNIPVDNTTSFVTANCEVLTSGVATITTATANNYKIGDVVTVSGVTPTFYNGTFEIASIISSTKFTYFIDFGLLGSQTVAGKVLINTRVATIESLNIRGGRMDVTAQPTAMQCSIDVVTDEGFNDTYCKLGANMVVRVYNPVLVSGVPIGWTPIFTGLMSDKSVSTNSWSTGDGLYVYTFSGYSRLASLQLSRQTYNSPSVVLKSTDSASDRILEVLSNWQYITDWFGAVNTDSIILHRRNGGVNGAKYFDYDVIESAATSARGCFHDRADGKVYYNNYANTLQTSLGQLFENHIIGNGVNSTRSITDVYTVCVVESTNQGLTAAQSSSTGGQIGLYGKRFGFRSTECQSQIEIDNQADAFLISRQNPRWRPSSITVDMGLIDVDDADEKLWLNRLFNVRTNSRMSLPFPVALGGVMDCLLDNWNWSFSRGRMFLEMQLSNVLDTHGSGEL